MKLSHVSAHNLHQLNIKNAGQAAKTGPKSVFSSHYSKGTRVKSALGSRKSATSSLYASHQATIESHKKKIIEAVNSLNAEELEKVSEMLKIAESLDSADKREAEDGVEAELAS